MKAYEFWILGLTEVRHLAPIPIPNGSGAQAWHSIPRVLS
jgi:hypothetical protein